MRLAKGNGHRWTFCLHFISYSCDSANYCRFSVMLQSPHQLAPRNPIAAASPHLPGVTYADSR